ncbi:MULTISPECIES: NIPSNAP family protein [unclassified Bradyrhizobium]|uniref:NIPSNAP family protein n=1 Tax=unclassified Bradyrhizobium TaxID=2631580 RepID=UPI002916A4D9|nr:MULTISPECIES: NIPSNAP family protein [unclassified Bradyrhizobium]
MQVKPVFCEVRYRLDPDRLGEFQEYGQAWVRLIERHGGVHHGFFMPRAAPGDATISFPGRGQAGAEDIAVALYGFPSEEAYNNYRARIGLDPEAASVIERFAEPPFKSYERIFLSPSSIGT